MIRGVKQSNGNRFGGGETDNKTPLWSIIGGQCQYLYVGIMEHNEHLHMNLGFNLTTR